MNEILKKKILVENNFMPERDVKQLRFTYSASRPFTKTKIETRKVKEK